MASGHGLPAQVYFENAHGVSAQSDFSSALGKRAFNDSTTAHALSGSSRRGPGRA